jgi:hypothetical protein
MRQHESQTPNGFVKAGKIPARPRGRLKQALTSEKTLDPFSVLAKTEKDRLLVTKLRSNAHSCQNVA